MINQSLLVGLDSFDSVTNLMSDIIKAGEVIEFTNKNNPFNSSTTLEYFFIILTGKVKIYDINFNTNREQTLYLLIKGDMFDLVSLLERDYHEFATDILESGSAIKIPVEKVRELMIQYPKFQDLIFKQIANQIRSLEKLSLSISLKSTKERLLELLEKNIEIFDKKGVEILKNLSQTEIANLIGTVRHIIERQFKELKEDGVIEDKKKLLNLKHSKKFLKLLNSHLE